MALTALKSPLLTYDEYIAEPEIVQRYDIIEGVRHFMSAPTWEHQRIQIHIAQLLEQFGQATGQGYAITAAFDLLIRRDPRLQTRQPDVLFISRGRLESAGGPPSKGPLSVGPELVVEIVSDSERVQALTGKLTDYTAIGVDEAWVVRPATRAVEVLRLAPNGPEIVATYAETEQLRSVVFPDLSLAVTDFF